MALRFEYRFYDYEQNLFKVNIYRHAYSDSTYFIQKAGANPVSIRGGGGDKNSMEDTAIQGQSLEFNFFLPRADITNIDYIFESKYKDYVLEYLDASDNIIFKGYVKPENLTKRFETNPPYIEIALTANDGLADLDGFDFRDTDESLIISRYSLLSILKKALLPVAGDVLNFNFRIQLNTYETNIMISTECVLNEIYADTRAFLDGEVVDDNPISCYNVIERILKPYNLIIKQADGEYLITNPHELDSYEYLFNWSLVFQSRTATSRLLDVSDKKFEPYIEEQKVHPLQYAYTNQRYSVKGNEYLSSDSWDDWTFSNFTTADVDTEDDSIVELFVLYQDPTTAEPSLTLTSDIALPKVSNTDYVIVKFDYNIDYFLSALDSNAQIYIKIELKRPNGDWSSPIYHLLDLRIRNTEVRFISSANSNLVVSEAGNYNVRISFVVKKGYYQSMIIFFKNPSIEIKPSTDRRSVSVSRRDGTSSSPSGRRTSGSTTRNREESDETRGRESSIEDKKYVLKQDNGYEKFEGDLHFGDVKDFPNFRENSSLINVFYDSSDGFTSSWNSYGNTEEAKLLFIYSKNVINNRQNYKTFIRCGMYDRNHTIGFKNILVINSKNYFISDYYRHYKEGYVELSLIELITTQLTYTENVLEEVETKNIIATDSDIQPLELEGVNQTTHNLEVGDIVRYDYATSQYVKAQADTADNAKAVGIVSEVLDNNQFKFVSDDYVRGDSALFQTLKTTYSLEEGEYYFLSPDTPGAIVKSADLTANNVEQCIGYVTTKGLKVQINARKIEPTLPTLSRAGKEVLVAGENTIIFETAFPTGTTYILWTYAYDDNNFQVGSYIIEESDGSDGTITGFTIYVQKACNLKYIATPIK